VTKEVEALIRRAEDIAKINRELVHWRKTAGWTYDFTPSMAVDGWDDDEVMVKVLGMIVESLGLPATHPFREHVAEVQHDVAYGIAIDYLHVARHMERAVELYYEQKEQEQ
jgi:hypothetical protein